MLASRRAAWSVLCAAAVFAADPKVLESALQAVADAKAKEYNCSISIAIRDGEGNAWQVVAGISDFATGEPARVSDPFVLGSITKTFTAAAALQLVDHGTWSLDHPFHGLVDTFLHQLGYPTLREKWGAEAERITLRDMLHMTSGIPDYDTSWDNGDKWRFAQYAQPLHDFSPLEIYLKLSGNLSFPPGTQQVYSSSNYVLVGLALAHQHGAKNWDDYDQSTVFSKHLKAQLKNTHFVKGGPCSQYTKEHGYDRMGPPVRPKEPGVGNATDVWSISCLGGWTAGNVVAPMVDVATWTEAFYGGDVITAASQAVVRNTTVVGERRSFYGIGAFDLSQASGVPLPEGEAWGHLGSTYGYQSINAYFPHSKATVVVGSNLEIRQQDHPSDALCFAYHNYLNYIAGRPAPTCTYKRTGYFFGLCDCKTATSQRTEGAVFV